MSKIILLVAWSLLLSGCDNSFDDCVLSHIKPGMDSVAAHIVKTSCENKYHVHAVASSCDGKNPFAGIADGTYDNQSTSPDK